jgi:hypothetical protein
MGCGAAVGRRGLRHDSTNVSLSSLLMGLRSVARDGEGSTRLRYRYEADAIAGVPVDRLLLPGECSTRTSSL